MLIPFGVFSAAGAGATNSYELISTTVLANSTTGVVTLSSIPQGYKHLQLRLVLRTTDTYSGGTYGTFYYNGGTGTLNEHTLYGTGGALVSNYASGYMAIERIATNYDATGLFGTSVIDILDYNNTNKYKTARQVGGFKGTGVSWVGMKSGLWQSTAAITEIAVSTPLPGSLFWVAGSRISLYGIKG